MSDGLKIETAASVILRDMIRNHMQMYSLTIRTNYRTGQQVTSAYIDGLAGAVALIIAAGHGSKAEVLDATINTLRESVDRDLQHLGGINGVRRT